MELYLLLDLLRSFKCIQMYCEGLEIFYELRLLAVWFGNFFLNERGCAAEAFGLEVMFRCSIHDIVNDEFAKGESGERPGFWLLV
jgi:hypothetical protein